MYFVKDFQPQVFKNNPSIKFSEVMKIVGERWKSMTVEEKAPYEEISRQRHIELNGMSSYYPTSTVKTESNDNNMKEILRIYTNAICQFFNSNMTSKLKQDNKEVTDEIIKTAIDSSWVKMSESQKYMYFLQNEKEIKDLHSILQDTEECPDSIDENNFWFWHFEWLLGNL